MPGHNDYVGQTIGNYIMLEKLGSGEFGSVYRAQNKLIAERVVAIKVINEKYVSSPEECERFLDEARVLLKLQHPSILPIFDIGEHQGTPYIVVEFAPEGSLSNYMARQQHRPVPLDKALLIITQLGQGLYFAHQQHIVHRDLKPDNILFNTKGQAMLADFGISIEVVTSTQRSTAISGTPPYMAPEQFQGITSMLSDQYALGCITYELLTGRRPFQASDFAGWALKHTQETPIPPRQLNPTISVSVEQAILKAMAKERTQRFATVAAFVAALSPQGVIPVAPSRKVLRSPAGQTVLGNTEVTIGRAPDNTYAINNSQVSGHHAVIRPQGQEYAIVDLQSTNKTYVNGQALPPQVAHILKPGDTIQVGQTSFEFANEISAPPTVAALPPTMAAYPPTVAAPPPAITPLPPTAAAIAPPPPTVAASPPPMAAFPPTVAAPPPALAATPPVYARGQYPGAPVLMTPQVMNTPSTPERNRKVLWIALGVIAVLFIAVFAVAAQNHTPKALALNQTYAGNLRDSAGNTSTMNFIFDSESQSTGVIQGRIAVASPFDFEGESTFSGTVDSQGNLSFSFTLQNGVTITFTGTVSSDNSSITSGQYQGTDRESGTWGVQK